MRVVAELVKMMRLLLISTFVALAAGAATQHRVAPRLDGRIVGGRDALIEEFPHQVSLQFFGKHACGASIITSRFIVTAAHCTDGQSVENLTIRAGSTRHGSGGQTLYVKAIHQHPKFNRRIIDYDISILELDGNLVFGPKVSAVALPNQDQNIEDGATATCSGWGTTKEGGSIPASLKAVNLNVIPQSDCLEAYFPFYDITERMFCAGVGGGKDACQGDSGGPLVINNELIGVVSWGIGCARPDFPGVFASVPYLREYVKEITGV